MEKKMKQTEIESKYLLNNVDYGRLLNKGKLNIIPMINHYYDIGDSDGYLRIRVTDSKQMLTLKRRVRCEDGQVHSVEYHKLFPAIVPKFVSKSDTSSEISPYIPDQGAPLQGSIFVMRHVVFNEDINLTLELDLVVLPSFKFFFELEFESEISREHDALKKYLKDLGIDPQESTMSKYERFLEDIR
jgi:uncharacterized protein YjbK